MCEELPRRSRTRARRAPLAAVAPSALTAVGCGAASSAPALTFSGSAVGREAEVLRRQLARFEAANPPLRVELRATPDSADERRQLYVQWLNAHAEDPDVLQLDVIWTPARGPAGIDAAQ